MFDRRKKYIFFSGGLSFEPIHQSSGSSFRDFFVCLVKTTKESEQPCWDHSIDKVRDADSFLRPLRVRLTAHSSAKRRVGWWLFPR